MKIITDLLLIVIIFLSTVLQVTAQKWVDISDGNGGRVSNFSLHL